MAVGPRPCVSADGACAALRACCSYACPVQCTCQAPVLHLPSANTRAWKVRPHTAFSLAGTASPYGGVSQGQRGRPTLPAWSPGAGAGCRPRKRCCRGCRWPRLSSSTPPWPPRARPSRSGAQRPCPRARASCSSCRSSSGRTRCGRARAHTCVCVCVRVCVRVHVRVCCCRRMTGAPWLAGTPAGAPRVAPPAYRPVCVLAPTHPGPPWCRTSWPAASPWSRARRWRTPRGTSSAD